MATTVSYSASMRTRKANSSSDYKSSAASQEFYTNDYNYVGIVHFSGMSLLNKVITAISLKVTSAKAGFGGGTSKTVYLRKSKYQSASESNVTGGNYYGDALGTFSGAFYDNTTSHSFSGALFDALATYFQAGNNTFCLFNPSPKASAQGYSNNYFQWTSATITVTYEEGVSEPSTSLANVDMGSAVTINTNRVSTSASHKLTYSFAGATGSIDANVGASVPWTPPLALAQQIPSATSGTCTITCETYYSGTLTGSKTCSITLHVPSSVVPTISSITTSEAVAGIAAQFGGYVQNKSKLSVSTTASGAQGSSIASYRATLGGSTYNAASFTTAFLSNVGDNTLSVIVTDSRGRTASTTRTIKVLSYAPPSLSQFKAERCNKDGTASQTDGTKVRVSTTASASSVNSKNTLTCKIYYKLSSASSWTLAEALSATNFAISDANKLLGQTYDALKSYDFKLTVDDYFQTVEQIVSVGTKQVMMDFCKDGNGIAFGKVAETTGSVEFGWPLILEKPLGLEQGGTGASNGVSACNNIGALPKSGGTMTGNVAIQGNLYPSLYLTPTYNNTTNRIVFEGSYLGAGSFAAWEDSTGNNRRMLEVRTAAYASSMDNAVLLRTAVNGTFYSYRVFHAGMATPVPVANGGTGASGAKAALSNLGIFYASSLPSSGTDGQICLVPV